METNKTYRSDSSRFLPVRQDVHDCFMEGQIPCAPSTCRPMQETVPQPTRCSRAEGHADPWTRKWFSSGMEPEETGSRSPMENKKKAGAWPSADPALMEPAMGFSGDTP